MQTPLLRPLLESLQEVEADLKNRAVAGQASHNYDIPTALQRVRAV